MLAELNNKKLPQKFYLQSVLNVARKLLGKIFVKSSNGELLAGRIVEVEAYDGLIDEASHAFIGKTKRNEVMFREGGLLYVYFTYGMYYCCNVVTGKKDEGKAVLIRALEPIEGIKQMALNRFGKDFLSGKELLNLTSGPGKICMAYNITRKENGTDLLDSKIYILNNKNIPDKDVVVSKRIGIKKSSELLWRFYIKNNPYVSKK
jgi:DNA-3-methyladenine glycosylase